MTGNLLRAETGGGYPTDYVIARLRGRRVALVSDWHALVARRGPTGDLDDFIWQEFLRELEWLHRQMNLPLRHAAAPLFGLFEMKTIVLCVRNASLGRYGATSHVLAHSQLAASLREILGRPTHASPMVAALAVLLAPLSPGFRELDARFAEGGLRNYDAALIRAYLDHTAATAKVHPDTRVFLRLFTDLRNLMTVYQHLRWPLGVPALLIDGGSLDPPRLRNLLANRDRTALEEVLTTAAGEPLAYGVGERSLETALLRGLTETMRPARPDRDGVALVLDYMWASYVQARTLALLHHGRGPDPNAIEPELTW